MFPERESNLTGGARKRGQSKEVGRQEWLDRINDLIRNSRTIWFALNGALVFAIVTLFSVQDIAFFDPTQRTRLPLLGIEVPVVWFFIAGSPLIAATYVYFHLYLTQLWQALGDAPATVNDRKLCDAIHPWIVSDAVLRLRDRLRGGTGNEEASQPRGMGFFAGPSTVFLVWLSGPLTTGYFWWRSMPAHDLLLTCWLAAMAVITASACYQSASVAETSLSRPGATAPWRKLYSGSIS